MEKLPPDGSTATARDDEAGGVDRPDRLAYLAHPLGPDGPARVENIARAKRWLAFLIAAYPDTAFVCSWVAYAEVLTESPENRARGMRDGREVQRWCDAIFLVGGRLSGGMAAELEFAHAEGQEVEDLLHLGSEPPIARGVAA